MQQRRTHVYKHLIKPLYRYKLITNDVTQVSAMHNYPKNN